jgi:hypothetical protein
MVKFFWAAPFLLATLLLGQSERANLTGSVTDPSGAPIAGVTVSVIHLATNTTASGSTDYTLGSNNPACTSPSQDLF